MRGATAVNVAGAGSATHVYRCVRSRGEACYAYCLAFAFHSCFCCGDSADHLAPHVFITSIAFVLGVAALISDDTSFTNSEYLKVCHARVAARSAAGTRPVSARFGALGSFGFLAASI